jgi:hypothetical protein
MWIEARYEINSTDNKKYSGGKIFAGFCEVKNILLKSEIPEKWIYVNTEKNGNIARCQEIKTNVQQKTDEKEQIELIS